MAMVRTGTAHGSTAERHGTRRFGAILGRAARCGSRSWRGQLRCRWSRRSSTTATRSQGLDPGLMHVDLGGYHIRDIEFCAALISHKDKVGKDSRTRSSGHTTRSSSPMFPPGRQGRARHDHDGLGKYSPRSSPRPRPDRDIVGILRQTRTDVVVNYLPSGVRKRSSGMPSRCSRRLRLRHCIAVFLAREPYGAAVSRSAGSRSSATISSAGRRHIVHRVLTRLFGGPGVSSSRTYQLNFGGNTDS